MFRVETNGNIMLSAGDNTGKIPVIVSDNNSIDSTQTIFSKDSFKVTVFGDFTVTIDKTIWRTKITETNLYSFKCINTWWALNQRIINLSDYGITVLGNFNSNDYFNVDFVSGNYGELIFYLMQSNSNYNESIFIKKFNSNYNLDEKLGCICININANDLLVDSINTFSSIPAGIYYYQLKAKLLNDNKQYEYITLMNKHCFYIIEDDYTDRVWTNAKCINTYTSQTNNNITIY